MNFIGCCLVPIVFIAGIIAMYFRRSRPAGLAVVVAAIVFTGWKIETAIHWNTAFAQIHTGDPASRVASLMGAPPKITNGTVSVYGGRKSAGVSTPGSTREYWYPAFFTPEQWSVEFDSSQKVISTYHYVCY